MKKLLLSLVLAVSLSGCGNLICAHDRRYIGPMSGVMTDVYLIKETSYNNYLNPLFIFDLPFSFLYDIILLPVAIAKRPEIN